MKIKGIIILNLLLATSILLSASSVNCYATITGIQSKEEIRLITELDSLKVKVEHVNFPKTRMEAELRKKNGLLVSRINQLSQYLSKKGKLTSSELAVAENDVKQLKYFTIQYCADMELLFKQSQKKR